MKFFQLVVFNLKEGWYFCCHSWPSKNSIQNSFDLNFFMKCCCKISIMQFYKLFKKIIWRHIYISKDDFINKALPFAKISPLACWWIWFFLSFLRKSHVADFIPIGTLCCSCPWLCNHFKDLNSKAFKRLSQILFFHQPQMEVGK